MLETVSHHVHAAQLRLILDGVFILEDKSYMIVDYESVYKAGSKLKYLDYVTRALSGCCRSWLGKGKVVIHMVVIYTGDVKDVTKELDVGCLSLRIEPVYLTDIDGAAELERITGNYVSDLKLTDDDVIILSVLPLTVAGKDELKQQMLVKVIAFARTVQDKDARALVLSLLAVEGVMKHKRQTLHLKGGSVSVALG